MQNSVLCFLQFNSLLFFLTLGHILLAITTQFHALGNQCGHGSFSDKSRAFEPEPWAVNPDSAIFQLCGQVLSLWCLSFLVYKAVLVIASSYGFVKEKYKVLRIVIGA